jgi:integrase
MKSARGMGNIYQPTYRDKRSGELKKVAVWWIVYSVNGKRMTENVRSTNRADAVRLLKKRTGAAAAGHPVGPNFDRTTLDDVLKMVEQDYEANGRRSLERVKDAGIHLRAFFGAERKVRDISSDRITAYQSARLKPDEGRPAAPSTINYELAMLRRGFRLGTRAGKVASRPEIQMLHVDNARQGFFELDQHRSVMKHLPDYLQTVAAIAYITGWRVKSELLTRHWRHVDFANGWLRLDPGESKNGDGRDFPFTPEMRSLLEAQRERVKEIEKRTGQIVSSVFCHSNGSRIKDFRGAWAQACDDAGVPGRLVHDFRRTAVRNLERAGVPRSAAMRMTGHKTEAVYRRYAITDSAMLQEAAIKLAAFHAFETISVERKSSAKVGA